MSRNTAPRDDDGALSLAVSNAEAGAATAWLRDQVREVAARGGRTESTKRAYTDAAVRILPFLDANRLSPGTVTPEQAACALLALGLGTPPYSAPCSASSVRLTATAIRVALVSQGRDPSAWCAPIAYQVLQELDKKVAPKAITPIRLDDLRRMVAAVAPTGHGIKIRTALLVMYAGALRVSEVASMTWRQVSANGQDLRVQVRRKRHTEWCLVDVISAADQALCPVRALAELQRAEGVSFQLLVDAPIFAAARTMQGWVSAMAQRAGLRGTFSPHSLRHGWASDAASAGIPLPAIQRHLGHASVESTSRYASHADLKRFY